MNLKFLSTDDLLLRLNKLVQTERKITHLILECINEIELRRIHLQMGYSSLFELLTQKFGYSAGSAQRRIDAARLMKQVPQLSEKLENGEVNLTQASLIQKSLRQAKVENKTELSQTEKLNLIEKVALANSEQTQVLLAKELSLQVPLTPQKIQQHQDSSVSVTLHLSSEEMTLMNQVKNLLSNSTQSLDLKKTILYLAEKELKKYESRNHPKIEKNNESKNDRKNAASSVKSKIAVKIEERAGAEIKITAGAETNTDLKSHQINSNSIKSISRATLRELLKPGAKCEYHDKKTNKTCDSEAFLSVDHIQPRWAGGGNGAENLRVFCKSHNQYRYQKQAGLSFV